MHVTETKPAGTALESLCVNTIRTLAMDAVQAANSGHPGTPMAMAPVGYVLWNEFLRFDPDDPIWPDRDRFVLSMGHASMLLYSLLHLAGVKAVNAEYERVGTLSVSLDDIKRFRQLDSRCAGHPEYRWTSGVETTTGPLGQGYATSVGMAIASKWMAATYNRPGFDLFGYDVYALGGDGCMMEGAASEAASLAGHLHLDNLCWIYDNNRITIEGSTGWAFSEDVATRFLAYGWNVVRVGDANDLDMVRRAFRVFKETHGRPTLIIVDSHIGYGSGKQDTHTAHGEPLGEEEIKRTKKFYGWPEEARFLVPAEVLGAFKVGLGARGRRLRGDWMLRFERYRAAHPDLAAQTLAIQKRELPAGWDSEIPTFPPDPKGVAGRDAGGKVLNAIAKRLPWLVGGAADLAPSTKTRLTFDGAGDFSPPRELFDAHGPRTTLGWNGRNFHFGIRELAMGSILNGMSLSKVRPFGSGFFVFSDFSRPAIRLAAIMEIPVIYVFTHDSIGVGEDGPTHQPIEHLVALRAIPGLIVLRPGDANEVAEAWRFVMTLRHKPACLVLSRQAMPTLDREIFAPASGVAKGAYVLACAAKDGRPEVILMASGTELGTAVEAFQMLKDKGLRPRVVSVPSWELFEDQNEAYKESVLPARVTARVSIEAGSTMGWERFVGHSGVSIGMRTFGASAPLKELQKKFGFTSAAVVEAALRQIELNRESRTTW
ncbi:MAG: transketolase [Phycisphaerae bacterium]|nr:transketolase [Phycisphaerae bacterium]